MTSKVHYLEMLDRRDLLGVERPAELEIELIQDGATNRRLYFEVGGAWSWFERLKWADEEWRSFAKQESIETWLASFQGKEAGFFELRKEGGNVEILLFGLRPEMIGKGLGAAMLTMAVERAWSIDGATRVWLHTCSEDHPVALRNYQKRGFRIYDLQEVEVPEC